MPAERRATRIAHGREDTPPSADVEVNIVRAGPASQRAFSGGGGLSTRFYRVYGREKDFLGVEIDRLKHIITPRIEYDYIHQPTVTAGELTGFDGVDSLAERNAVRLSLENKLQTRRKRPGQKEGEGEKEAVDLVYLKTEIDYFPRPESSSIRAFKCCSCCPFSGMTSSGFLR